MKNLFVFALVLFMGIGMVSAQPGNRDPEARIQQEVEGLTKALSLSKDQVAKIKPIIKAAQEKQMEMFTEMRESGDMDREKMRETMTKMRTEQDKKIKAVLTEEQGKKLAKYREEQAEQRGQRMGR